jgi:DNA repair protein RadC
MDEDEDFYDDDGFDAYDPISYAEPEEQLVWGGVLGLGATRAKGQAKHVCVSEHDKFHWMRMNVCADWNYRRGDSSYDPPSRIRSSRDISEFVRQALPVDLSGVELAIVVILNAKNTPIGVYEAHRGGIDASIVDPRVIFQPALLMGGSSIIMVHNHPSGDPTPSPEDVALTERLLRAGTFIGVRMLDHVIIGGSGYFSFLDAGLLTTGEEG